MIKWIIDPVHSEIAFKARHLMISTVRGHFSKFEGSIEAEDETLNNGVIKFETDISSLETRHPDRNGHLLSADFFDVSNFPKMSFASTSVKRKDDELNITGDLTIKGITKEVKLTAKVNGTNTGMEGENITGFDLTGKISRKDFGMVWNVALETGGVLIGDNIDIEAFVEAKKE